MKKPSKRITDTKKQVDPEKQYPLQEAIEQIGQFQKTKFDETVELHFHLGIDPKANEQAVRGTVVLPHGTGKAIKIAVVCKGEAEIKAKEAGANFVGHKSLIDKIENGFLDFDVLIASPDMMRDLSKLGKILGPRGLMPTPKAGTVTADVAKAIQEVKAGKIEFKSDKQAGIHVGIAKRSFSNDQIRENVNHLLNAVNQARPNALKGNYIKSMVLSTTMGPGVKVAV